MRVTGRIMGKIETVNSITLQLRVEKMVGKKLKKADGRDEL